MRSVVVAESQDGLRASLTEVDEPSGDGVLIDVSHSGINYKDALALSGSRAVVRRAPLVAGIDAAGVLAEPLGELPIGTAVIVTGAGHGEEKDGGYAALLRADPAVVLPVPSRFSAADAAAIGTAGVTAALAVLALERAGLPEGPVLVTGGGGGLAGFAIALLAARGHEVVASTGRGAELGDRLRGLGASEVIDRLPAEAGRPLVSERWAGAIDALGGGPLVGVLASTRRGGAVAACGMAADLALPGASVAPFILRGVSLLGIDSVRARRTEREAAWAMLAEHLASSTVADLVAATVGLDDVIAAAHDVLAGRVDGRLVVDVLR